jgi:hypothetical protein
MWRREKRLHPLRSPDFDFELGWARPRARRVRKEGMRRQASMSVIAWLRQRSCWMACPS